MANLKDTLDAVRNAVSNCDLSVSEEDLYDALGVEAFGWQMRLEELEKEG